MHKEQMTKAGFTCHEHDVWTRNIWKREIEMVITPRLRYLKTYNSKGKEIHVPIEILLRMMIDCGIVKEDENGTSTT